MQGLSALSDADAVVIVDVLSFSTCVDVALAAGAEVFPFAYKDDRAEAFALKHDAILASFTRSYTIPSLSPVSLVEHCPPRLVLPSPNGAELTTLASHGNCYTACLRNARAVAVIVSMHESIAVIAAGERWPDGSVRFAIEDLIGAGAVIHFLGGSRSPEAQLAEQAFVSAKPDLHSVIGDSISGEELAERGFERDVDLATQLNVSEVVPKLSEGRYLRLG